MIYMRPTQTGYSAFDCYHTLLFTEENCHQLFSFIESDTNTIKEMLQTYFETVIDAESLTFKDRILAKKLKEDIKKEMKKLHPYLASNQYISVYRMLAEHLNQQIVKHSGSIIAKESYETLLQALVRPLFTPGVQPMPPICVPTSDMFMGKYYSQLNAMYERKANVLGLDYVEKIRIDAERYIYWVLDRSCFRFKDIDRGTRIRLYSRIFREHLIGADLRIEQCSYYREPKQYDYFANTPTGQLLNEMQNHASVEESLSKIAQKKENKVHHREMLEQLKYITADTQEITQEMKDFMDAELDAATADASSTLFEEYRVDNFNKAIQLQLWLLTKGDTIIKKCRHCNRLFVAERLSTDYCSRIQNNESEPCDIVGPKKSFARLMDEDHILKTYNRVYKTIYARKKRGSITDDEFNRWKTEARNLLDKTREGGMSEADFEAWLTQDIRAWGDSGK